MTSGSRSCVGRFSLGLMTLGMILSINLSCSTRPEGVQVSTAQRVHPVLIRKEHNPLIQVIVQADQEGVRATSFSFTLTGTDDIEDIESLQMFYSGTEGELTTATSFGSTLKPSQRLTFDGDQMLSAGTNVFWLACRLNPTADLSHRVAAASTSVRTSAGDVTPTENERPGIRKRIGVALRQHMDDGVHTYRIPALATTPRGTLLSVYDMRHRKSRDLQEDIDIGLSRSTDGGRSWEPQRVIMDMGEWGDLPAEENGVSDPGIVVDQETGEIFCAAVWMWDKLGKHQWVDDGSEPGFEIGKSAQFLMVRSKDDGLTWSKPENLTSKLKKPEWWLFAPAPNQGITLRDGTLVMPSQGRDENGYPFANIMYSRDHGETWTLSNHAFSGGNECQAVQLSDGSLMLNMRNDKPEPYRAVYVTQDLGQTWSPHSTDRNTLIEPNCNGSLYRFEYEEEGQPKNILLFANPHTKKGRTHHTLQISFDEGKSWPAEYRILLDEGLGRGYPSISRVDDSHIGIVYEGSPSDLVFEKFSLQELLTKKEPQS